MSISQRQTFNPSPHDNTAGSMRGSTSAGEADSEDTSRESPTTTDSASSCFSSSYTSFSSDFDSPRHTHSRSYSCASDSDRRTSTSSTTSWESEAEEKMEKNMFKLEDTRENQASSNIYRSIQARSKPGSSTLPASGFDSGITQNLATPHDERSSFLSFRDDEDTHSPASSVTSSAPSKDGSTPRAELPAPIWPLSPLHSSVPGSLLQLNSGFASGSTSRKGSRLVHEDLQQLSINNDAHSGMNGSGAAITSNIIGKGSLKQDGSLKKKQSSHDAPPQLAAGSTAAFAAFSSLREVPPFKALSLPKNKSRPSSTSPTPPTKSLSQPPPQINTNVSSGSGFHDASSPFSTSRPSPSRSNTATQIDPNPTTHKVVATSPTTGCTISAPISPPAHYPLPTPPVHRDQFHLNHNRNPSKTDANSTPTSSSASTKSSSSSSRSSISNPPPPRWARPPTKSNSISGRAMSMSMADKAVMQERTDVDFDPELFEGQEGEWIEIIKGSEGRIAVKSTPKEYLVMVWLPGFSISRLPLEVRELSTLLQISGMREWDIKLGADANLGAVAAKFSGDELRISVARNWHRANQGWWTHADNDNAQIRDEAKMEPGGGNEKARYPRTPASANHSS